MVRAVVVNVARLNSARRVLDCHNPKLDTTEQRLRWVLERLDGHVLQLARTDGRASPCTLRFPLRPCSKSALAPDKSSVWPWPTCLHARRRLFPEHDTLEDTDA